MNPNDPEILAFWSRFAASDPDGRFAGRPLYDTFSIGDSRESRDRGAALILAGEKTATSSVAGDYAPPARPPRVGDLSILLDGAEQPVAVVETVEIRTLAIGGIDEALARDYGEWDRTLPTLRRRLLAAYGDVPLFCERFQVVWRGIGPVAPPFRHDDP